MQLYRLWRSVHTYRHRQVYIDRYNGSVTIATVLNFDGDGDGTCEQTFNSVDETCWLRDATSL